MLKTANVILLLSLLILSVNFVVAETSFRGEVRDVNPVIGPLVDGANITVICNDNTKFGVSGSDGKYGIIFSEVECNISDNYIISAIKGNRSGSESGSVDSIDMMIYFALTETIIPVVIGNTTINGTIYYDSINGSVVDGADVTVTCNGIDLDVVSVNGSYSVDFSEDVCNDSHVYSVIASEGEYSGASGDLNVVDGTVADLIIVKPIETQNTGSGKSSGRPTMCADGYHFEREGSSRCVPDVVVVVENEMVEELDEPLEGNFVAEPEEDNAPEPGFFSAITGAVIGGRTTGVGIAALFLLLVIIALVIVRRNKKKK